LMTNYNFIRNNFLSVYKQHTQALKGIIVRFKLFENKLRKSDWNSYHSNALFVFLFCLVATIAASMM